MNCSYIRAENIDKKISSRGASDVSEMIELILSALDRYRYRYSEALLHRING